MEATFLNLIQGAYDDRTVQFRVASNTCFADPAHWTGTADFFDGGAAASPYPALYR